MIKVSEFSSLDFRRDWKLDFQQNVDYVQEFLYTDIIQVQYITTDFSVLPILSNNTTGVSEGLTPKILYDGETERCCQLSISHDVTEDTCFTLSFVNESGTLLSSEYIVRMELPGTIYLEYTNRRNVLNTIFEDRFTFRVVGSFLPQEVQFSNDTEDFRDQRFIPKVLSSNAYEQKKLTLGGGFGVPNWVARKINLIFSLSSVHVDGVPMVRSEGSAVEITVLGNYYPLYIYKLLLEESGEEVEGSGELLTYLRSVDEKKKLVRSISEDEFRTYIDDLGLDMAKMIRELELITELSENYYIEIDDNTTFSTKKTNLISLANFLKSYLVGLDRWSRYINQPLKSTDTPTFARIFTDEITSTNYTPGLLGSGHQLKDGKLEIDELVVRQRATFIEVIAQKMRYMGGVYVLSPAAGFQATEVEITEDYYRCFFNEDNEFVVGDQARIQDFTTGKEFWSLVINVGSNYIDLSRTDCVGEGIPQAGDEIVQLGNRDNVDRQDAVLLTAVNGEVGIITYYGINSFTLEGKEGSWLGKHGGKKGAVIKGEFFFESGQSVKDAIDSMSGATSEKEIVVDLTDLDVNSYYPLVFPANNEPEVSYRVYHGLSDGSVSWSIQFYGQFIMDCQWDNYGGGVSDIADDRYVNVFEYELTKGNISPIGKLGKITYGLSNGKSQEYCYLRGGAIYRCRIPSVLEGNPIIHPQGYTADSGLYLHVYNLTDLLTAPTIDVEAVEEIIPKPVVWIKSIETSVEFTKNRLSLIATEEMYSSVEAGSTLLGVMSSRIDVTAQGITLLNQQYRDINGRLTTAESKITINTEGITLLNEQITQFGDDMESVENRITLSEEGIELLNDNISATNGEVTSVKNQVNLNKEGITLLNSNLTTTNNNVTSVTNRVALTESGITAINENVEELTTDYGTFKTNVTNEITLNKNGISALTTQVNTINGNIEDINTGIAEINNRLTNTADSLTNLEGSFEEIAQDLSELDGDYQEVKVAGIVTNSNFVTIFAGKANSLGESMVAGINVVPEGVTIQGSKISLNGAVAVNSSDGETTVSINNETGVLIANGAIIKGNVEAYSGKIGEFLIDNDGLTVGNAVSGITMLPTYFHLIHQNSYTGTVTKKIEAVFGATDAYIEDDPAFSFYKLYSLATERYIPTMQVGSEGSTNVAIAIKTKGSIVCDRSIIETAYVYWDASEATVLNLSKSTRFLIKNNTDRYIYFPRGSEIRDLTGGVFPCCIRLDICAHYSNTAPIRLGFADVGTMYDHNGSIITEYVLQSGDAVSILVTYDSVSYCYTQFISQID